MTDLYAEEIAALRRSGETWADALGHLGALSCESEELPATVREIGLAMAYAGRGMTDECRRHGQRALDAGIERGQVVEALLSGVLHGGMGIFWANRWLIDEAADGDVPVPEGQMDADSVVQFFTDVWGGTLPSWISAIGDASPELLLAYHGVRAIALGDGALPKKYKELLIVLMSCVEHYDFGIEVHIKNAMAAGATRTEVIDTVRSSQVAGGIVAWLSGFTLADQIFRDADSA